MSSPLSAPERRAASSAADAAGDESAHQVRRVWLNTLPWGVATAGGKSLGETPLRGVEVPPGASSLIVTSPEHGSRAFSLSDAESQRLGCWDFAAGAACKR